MNSNTLSDKMKSFAPALLRYGISLVFLWFGTQQFLNTGMWLRLIPESLVNMTGLTATTFVHFNGAFEIVFAILLIIGFNSRIVSLLLALHMIHITTVVGYNAVGVRDFGLAIAAVTVFLSGMDKFTLDAYLAKKKTPNPLVYQ